MQAAPNPEPDALERDREALETCEVRDRAEPGKVLFRHPKLRDRILGYLDRLAAAERELAEATARAEGAEIDLKLEKALPDSVVAREELKRVEADLAAMTDKRDALERALAYETKMCDEAQKIMARLVGMQTPVLTPDEIELAKQLEPTARALKARASRGEEG